MPSDQSEMQVDTTTKTTTRKGRGFESTKSQSNSIKFDSLGSSTSIIKSIEGWIVVIVNVHPESSEEDLLQLVLDYAPVKNIHLNLDRRTGYVKGYCLVEFSEYEEAKKVVDQLNGYEFLGNQLKCDFAFVRPRR